MLTGELKTTTGVVYKQGLVLDESGEGRPTFAEYERASGELVRVLEAGALADAERPLRIDNGRDYRAAREQYLAYLDSLAPDRLESLRVVPAVAYPPDDYPAGVAPGEPFAVSVSGTASGEAIGTH